MASSSSSSNAANQWCTIESDPGVFTCLIESFGVKNVELTELYSLDDDSLQLLVGEENVVHGLVFLFKWERELPQAPSAGEPLVGDACPSQLFFARQVTPNACATLAILSVLLNSRHADSSCAKNLQLGPILEAFRAVSFTFPPDLRGEAIEASDEIRTAHNSFARRDDAFLVDPDEDVSKRKSKGTEDVYHFIAYVPHEGGVYELDGLREGPVLLGKFEEEGETTKSDLPWLKVARTAVQERMEAYGGAEIKFNLMALVRDRRSILQAQLSAGQESADEVRAQLAMEEEKRAQWAVENERRRHNYLPFCMELLMALAQTGNLPKYTQRAKERMVQLRRAAKAASSGKGKAATDVGV